MSANDERAARIERYEQACDRFNLASAMYPEAKAEAARILGAAEAELEEAQRCLAMFEKYPGVPRDEFNKFKA